MKITIFLNASSDPCLCIIDEQFAIFLLSGKHTKNDSHEIIKNNETDNTNNNEHIDNNKTLTQIA